MPSITPGSTYVKGNEGVIVPQESSGELKTVIEGKHGDTILPMALDSDGNQMGYKELEIFRDILCELRKMNLQLSMITDYEIRGSDVK